MNDREQIRPEKETVGKSAERSALSMSREQEQKVIKEFRSPFPNERERDRSLVLLQNTAWIRAIQ